MDDALVVGGGEPTRDLEGDLDRLARRQRTVLEPLAERLALEQLHGGVDGALLAAEVVYGEDVGVREGGHRLRLALEAREGLRVLGEVPRQHLDGDVALELRVPCPVDDTHAALAELREDLVRSDPGSGNDGHARRGEYTPRGFRSSGP